MKTSGDFVYLIDTYAWIEYFIGSKKKEQVKQLIENKTNIILTSESCLAEIKGWDLRENVDFDELYAVIRRISSIQCILPGTGWKLHLFEMK